MATGSIKKVSNDNDTNYCKMPDGTLIQWGQASLGSKQTNAQGNIYGIGYTGSPLVSFPLEFISTDGMSVSVSPRGGTYEIISAMNADYRGILGIDFARPTAGSISGNIYWFAIGRWK